MTFTQQLRGKMIESVAWQGNDAVLIFSDHTHLKVGPQDWESSLMRRDIRAAAMFSPDINDKLEQGFWERGAF